MTNLIEGLYGLWHLTTGLTVFLCYNPLVAAFRANSRVTKAAPLDEHQRNLSMPSRAQENLCGLSTTCTRVCCQLQWEWVSAGTVTRHTSLSCSESHRLLSGSHFALLALTTQVPAVAANNAGGPSQHHNRNSKFRKLCYCWFFNS